MSVYDYTYSYFSTYLTPVYRRLTNTLALINVWLSPLEWLRNSVWNHRRIGTLGYNYDNLVTYTKGQIANYGSATYVAIQTTLGNLPTDTSYWRLSADNMVGWEERIIYNGRKKSLEYMLFRFFGNYDYSLNFSNTIPNDNSPKSIYIETVQPAMAFISYNSTGSASIENSYTTNDGVYLNYSNSTISNAIIHIPTSTSTVFGGNSLTEKVALSLVKKYAIAGITFSVNFY